MHETRTLQRALPPWLKPAGIALLSLGFVCLTLTLLTPSYMTNDDVAIMDYATHGFAVRYTGIFFTSLLHLGYVHLPDVAWYGWSLYALQVLAIYLWLTLVFRVFRPGWLAAVFALLLLGYCLVFLIYLDYTSVSVMLCAASLTWGYLDVMERRAGWLHYLGLGLVFMLGMMVRPHGAPGTLIYTFPIGLLAAWASLRGSPLKPELRRLVLVGVLFLAPAVAEFGLDQAWRAYTATPQQEQYDTFNAVRGKLHRISRGRKQAVMKDRALLKSVHWTRRDAAFFFNWNFLDERIYTPQALQTVFDGAPPPRASLSSIVTTFGRRITPYNSVFLLLIAPLPLLLWAWRRRRDRGVTALVFPVYEAVLTTFMYLFFAYTVRVELPFETGFGFCALLVVGWLVQREWQAPTRATTVVMGLCVMLAAVGLGQSLWNGWRGYQGQEERAAHLQQTLDLLNREHAGDVILMEPNAGLAMGSANPLRVMHMDFHPVQLGWSTFSPRFYSQISELGISHGYELVDALISHDHAYMLGRKGWCEKLLPYATVPGADKLQPVLVSKVTRGAGLYRFGPETK